MRKRARATWGRGVLVTLSALTSSLVMPISAEAAYQTSNLIVDWNGSSLTNSTSDWVDGTSNAATLNQYGTTYNSGSGGYVSLSGAGTSYLRAPNNLPTFNTSNFSAFFWIKPSSNAGAIFQIGRSPTVADSEAYLTINGSGNLVWWDFNGSTGFNSFASTGTLTLNQWNYVGFTKSTSVTTSTLTFYINGSASGFTTATDKALSLNDFVIGKEYRDNSSFYSGGIARASIWNSALTAAEVSANYSATNGITTAPSISTTNSTQSVSAGSAIATAVTTNSGGSINSFSISPSLPNGLTMDGSGNISGTPTAIQSQATYTITATNPAGTSTSTFTLTVTANNSASTITNIPTAVVRQVTNFVVTVTGGAGKVTFKQNGKNIPGCVRIATVTTSSTFATCPWRPSIRSTVTLSATYAPTSNTYLPSAAPSIRVLVTPRIGKR